MKCDRCGETVLSIKRVGQGEWLCEKCNGAPIRVGAISLNRRMEKEYLPQLGCWVSESNKSEVEKKFNVKIINEPQSSMNKRILSKLPNPKQKQWDKEERHRKVREAERAFGIKPTKLKSGEFSNERR